MMARIFFCFLFIGNVACLAIQHRSPEQIVSVLSTKRDGGISKTFSFDKTPKTTKDNKKAGVSTSPKSIASIKAAIKSTFLPAGYPSKTPVGYLPFSIWSWTQDLSTQLRGVLATQRVLEGVGVGREGATALSALMNFIVRDGCGMAANLLFTWVAASRFKSDIKRWRLFADIMVDLGITLEVAATNLPPALFLPMICLGSVCKSICGVAAGACGGAINVHWAKGSDISDVMAKQGAQNTVTGSLGLVFAALFARSVSKVNEVHLWALYTILTLLHIFANMQCMKLVAFDSLNSARMNLVAGEFFRCFHNVSSSSSSTNNNGQRKNEVSSNLSPNLPGPVETAKAEPLFYGSLRKPSNKLAPYPIHYGVSFEEFVRRSNKPLSSVRELIAYNLDKRNYIISVGYSNHWRQEQEQQQKQYFSITKATKSNTGPNNIQHN
mmetsp:Transcript_13972/g.21788  ORF Transcript_13972/g.21788 Transcript_13972/m.21788 type:complete len:438 (+) Transcript_13972:90-1403(+)